MPVGGNPHGCHPGRSAAESRDPGAVGDARACGPGSRIRACARSGMTGAVYAAAPHPDPLPALMLFAANVGVARGEGAGGAQVWEAGISFAVHDVFIPRVTGRTPRVVLRIPEMRRAVVLEPPSQHRSRGRHSLSFAWLAARPAERQGRGSGCGQVAVRERPGSVSGPKQAPGQARTRSGRAFFASQPEFRSRVSGREPERPASPSFLLTLVMSERQEETARARVEGRRHGSPNVCGALGRQPTDVGAACLSPLSSAIGAPCGRWQPRSL